MKSEKYYGVTAGKVMWTLAVAVPAMTAVGIVLDKQFDKGMHDKITNTEKDLVFWGVPVIAVSYVGPYITLAVIGVGSALMDNDTKQQLSRGYNNKVNQAVNYLADAASKYFDVVADYATDFGAQAIGCFGYCKAATDAEL